MRFVRIPKARSLFTLLVVVVLGDSPLVDAEEPGSVGAATLQALANLPEDQAAFSAASKELRPPYLEVAHPLVQTLLGEAWKAKAYPSKGRIFVNNQQVPGFHWSFNESWNGGNWVELEGISRRKEIVLTASIRHPNPDDPNIEARFTPGPGHQRSFTLREVEFHGMRAVHGTMKEGRVQCLRWMKGGHRIEVDLALQNGKPDVLAAAEKVHAAALKSGWYDFPGSLLESKIKVTGIEALDANPQFFHGGESLPADLKPSQLIRASEIRKGTSADGASQLILRAEVSEATPVVFALEADGRGTLEPLLDGKTVTFQEKHYAFALYSPPEHFGGGALEKTPKVIMDPSAVPKQRLGEVLEVEDLVVSAMPYEINPAGEGTPVVSGKSELELKLARSPLVLVHGLFSNPVDCWVRTKDTGSSLVVLLERHGFLPFLVNYQQSNGTETLGESWMTGEENPRTSGFAENRRVVWDSPDPYHAVDESGWFADEPPIRTYLQKPKKMHIGGIKQALEYYRDELGIAATRADVIGHSMGGLLTRVWASAHYHPEYERAENFHKGDVARLITLNTPHHGSELTELKDAIEKAVIENEGWLDWARRQLAKKPLWWYTESNAIRDLRTGSTALRRIGPTPVRSYAVTTWADDGAMGGNDYDEADAYLHLYSVAGMMFFQNRALLDDFVRSRFVRWRNTAEPFQQMTDFEGNPAEGFSEESSQEEYARILSANLDHNVLFWAARREQAYQQELLNQIRGTFLFAPGHLSSDMGQSDMDLIASSTKSALSHLLVGGDVTRVPDLSKPQDAPVEFMAQLRALVFHNDHMNDGAVRVASQTGGLEATESIRGVLHSFSPWHYAVQSRLIALLKWEDEKFSDEGFGPAGQLTNRYLPTDRFKNDRVYGERASRWSGYVPSHVREYAAVADREHTVILGRPVNHDSTALIADGAATKAMAVKGKSASWGPQRGFIPFKQRFSKIWRINAGDPSLRDTNIKKFDAITEEMLETEHPVQTGKFYAVLVPLVVKAGGKEYEVFHDPAEKDAEKAIVLHAGGTFFDWQTGGEGEFDRTREPNELAPQPSASQAATYRQNPMSVLADGLSTEDPPPYLTADYDLLAIGFHRDDGLVGPPPEVAQAKFHPVWGAVSPDQIDLIKALNTAAHEGAGYESGNLTHHGPENQYSGSPYIDYPIIVFDPGTKEPGDQEVFIIRQGPIGFRDIHLKRYFSEMNQRGFNLWPNALEGNQGWLWRRSSTFERDNSYDPRDHADLLKYIDEAPEPGAEDGDGNPDSEEPRQAEHDPDVDYKEMAVPDLQQRAESGDPKAMNLLAYRLGKGDGVPKDDAAAAKWFLLAAEAGDVTAMTNIARRFAAGRGVPKDSKKARHWFEQAALLGHRDGYSGLGYHQAKGIGGPKDTAAALENYRKAVEMGDAYAMNNLALFYRDGIEVERDYDEALKLFRQAAEKGNRLGQRNLAKLYFNGTGVRTNYAEALTWFEKAAAQGDATAANFIGAIHGRGGHGVEQDKQKALEWYERAAKAGSATAQLNYGVYLLNGRAGKPDPYEAYVWFLVAAENGKADADDRVAEAGKKLDAAQKRSARARAREIMEGQ